MNILTWLLLGALATLFLWSAWCKGTWAREVLVARGQTGVEGLPVPVIRFIAFCELLGAIGLVVPSLTGIAPRLTSAAALGLALIMVLAAIVHARRREPWAVAANVVILGACLFVAWRA